jgi:DNA adenine methylase
MRYDGGKGRCYQRIINLMPPHRVYIELFLGGGAVMRNKRPAASSIGIDLDARVVSRWKSIQTHAFTLHHGDAFEFLANYDFVGDELVYADPPYLPSTRRRHRVYRHDLGESEHASLLTALRTVPCAVMLSGYPSDLYDTHLDGWHRTEFEGTSHIGARREVIWQNFTPTAVLHDYSYVGETFRDRERLKRRVQRWRRRLEIMPEDERLALLSELLDMSRSLLSNDGYGSSSE